MGPAEGARAPRPARSPRSTLDLEAAPRLLVTRKGLAELLSVSLRTVDSMRAAGELPAPIALPGGALRWRLADVEAWIAKRPARESDARDLRRGTRA